MEDIGRSYGKDYGGRYGDRYGGRYGGRSCTCYGSWYNWYIRVMAGIIVAIMEGTIMVHFISLSFRA